MRGLNAVARFAAAQCIVQLRGNGALRALPFGELVQRAVEVFAEVDTARVEDEVRGPRLVGFLVVDGVVERIVAFNAGHDALGMDVPGAAEGFFVAQIQAGVGDALRGYDLPCGFRAPTATVQGEGNLVVGVDEAVALAAVVVSGVLDVQAHVSFFIKCFSLPLPLPIYLLYQTAAVQCGGVGPAECARGQRRDARLVVGGGRVAQEAVHFHYARRRPIPGEGLPGGRVYGAGFWVCCVGRQQRQQFSRAAIFGRSAADVTRSQELYPIGCCQVKDGVADGGEGAVGEGVPAAKNAGTHVPHLSPHDRARRRKRTQPGVAVETVRGNKIRIMARAAGVHRGNGLVRVQNVFPVFVQQGECGVQAW